MDKAANVVQISPLTVEEGQMLSPLSYEKAEYAKEDLFLQAAYLAALNAFLQEEIDLNAYQKEMDESKYSFSYTDKTIYAKVGLFGRANIALRNIPYVERLTEEQKTILLNAVVGENQLSITEEVLDLVNSTWKSIIQVQLEEGVDEPYMIIYDVEASGDYEAMSDALTFELAYDDEYDENGNADDEADAEKMAFAEALKAKMEKEISEDLNCNVTVFIKNRG